MDIQLSTSYLKVQVVYSCMINHTPIKTVVKKGFWPWEKDEVETEDSWTLTLDCLKFDGSRWQFTCKAKTYTDIKEAFDSVMKQIKDQDSSYADKLLEDAIISGGKDKP
jgi:hypothetical protein